MPYSLNNTGFQRTDTSRAAAAMIEPSKSSIRRAVLAYMRRHRRPMDSEEIARGIGSPECSVRPRMTELRHDGRVVDSGGRTKSKYGRDCIMWALPQSKPAPQAQADMFEGGA